MLLIFYIHTLKSSGNLFHLDEASLIVDGDAVAVGQTPNLDDEGAIGSVRRIATCEDAKLIRIRAQI